MNKKRDKIIYSAFTENNTHDFKLYEKSIGSTISGDKKVQADKGYQGIANLHTNNETSKKKKKPKGGQLTDAESKENGRISRERIVIENINVKIKVFKVALSKYHN